MKTTGHGAAARVLVLMIAAGALAGGGLAGAGWAQPPAKEPKPEQQDRGGKGKGKSGGGGENAGGEKNKGGGKPAEADEADDADDASEQAKSKHPRLWKAVRDLRDAKKYMLEAKDDFGGHKAAAIAATDEAIKQLNLAMESAGATGEPGDDAHKAEKGGGKPEGDQGGGKGKGQGGSGGGQGKGKGKGGG
jgi:hypothetical protein